jgi:hypothetical protein
MEKTTTRRSESDGAAARRRMLEQRVERAIVRLRQATLELETAAETLLREEIVCALVASRRAKTRPARLGCRRRKR